MFVPLCTGLGGGKNENGAGGKNEEKDLEKLEIY